MGIEIVSYRITGISPLLMNNPAGMVATPAGLNTKKVIVPAEEAATKVYKTDEGELYIPATAFRSALLGACAGRRIGKLGAGTIIAGTVFSVGDREMLVHPESNKPIKTYVVNSMSAVVNKCRIIRSRPEIREWAVNLDFEVDTEHLPETRFILDLLNIAGRMRGVGDFRPQKRGPYGRFVAALAHNAIGGAKPKSKRSAA